MKTPSSGNVSRRNFIKKTATIGAASAVAAGAVLSGASLSGKKGGLPGVIKRASEKVFHSNAGKDKIVPTFCAMCGPSAGCGIYAIVKDGKFVGVEGMKELPLNRGRLCAKAHTAPQWVYSKDRLKYPLRRIGAKGEGKFERISWDEALDTIANKLKEQKAKYGAESLAVLSPAHRSYSAYMYRFLAAHGSPNYGHSGICAMQRAFNYAYTLGTSPRADLAKTKLVIIWGKQPVYAGSSKGGVRELLAAKERGAKIVAIKPTMEPDVALADVWVPVRPGTDAALALAFLHVIVGEKLYDTEFVEKWTHGFPELAKHVKQYTPEWAEPITGVKAEQIRSVARLYATTKPACIEDGNGLEHAPSCNDTIRSLAILRAITGNLDRPGGDLLSAPVGGGKKGAKSFTLRERYTQEWVDKLVCPEFPRAFQPMNEGTSSAYYGIFESILTEKPYPIRAIIAPGTQPTVTTRGTASVIEALKKLDFYVVVDVTRTADMDYADIVVPVTTMYETDHPFESGEGWIMARNKVIEPLGEYKSDYEFWIDLGVRMGYGEDFWHGSVKEWTKELLAPHKMTIEELRAHPTGVATEKKAGGPVYEKYAQVFAAKSTRLDHGPLLPQGKVAIYNTTFEEHGFNPLPVWVEVPEGPTATPELLKKYPLVFSDFHTSKVYNAGWLRNVPYLREILTDPTVQIHPHTAKARGIVHGDWVIVESPYNSLRLKAEVNLGIRPDTVMALHGWWQGCEELKKGDTPLVKGGGNAATMYSTDHKKAWDPLVTANSSQTLVQIRKA